MTDQENDYMEQLINQIPESIIHGIFSGILENLTGMEVSVHKHRAKESFPHQNPSTNIELFENIEFLQHVVDEKIADEKLWNFHLNVGVNK